MPDGRTRFRLWAPDAHNVALALPTGEQPMAAQGDGWFELACDCASGAAYSFLVDGEKRPDPAARAQAGDVHGASRLVDAQSYRWQETGWQGRPWEEAVIYELHTGTFTPQGTFRGAIDRLDHLLALGVTAIELMPVAQFSGNRGWGYDGVLIYAPHPAYGTPDDLKALIDAAHAKGLMIFLDVVYNHFGPDGNYLPSYASAFFDPARQTPWGAAIDYTQRPVRDFFIENALYWLEEFRFDGLRLDAIDNIRDPSRYHVLVELARTVHARVDDRHVHLTTEDNRNIVYFHPRDSAYEPTLYTAEWNDDLHNAAHVIATGESGGYYEDFIEDPWAKLARALAEGFAYQGEISPYMGNQPRGDPSRDQPSVAFIAFLQNHDQVGNRALGERLVSLAAAPALHVLVAMLLLSPQIPLLFMGEEWGETRPFLFFTDFHGDLARAVREGRRREFAKFSAFADADARAAIPDPNAPASFAASRLDWSGANDDAAGWLAFYKRLLALRQARIVPLLRQSEGGAGRVITVEEGFAVVRWRFGDRRLWMAINLSGGPRATAFPEGGAMLFALGEAPGQLASPGIAVLLEEVAP